MNKIKVGPQWLDGHHRSGWPFAINSLRCLHSDEGVLFDGFIEKKFAWGRDPGDRYNGFAPYNEPWIGILHNPPNIPEWFNLNQHSPFDILKTEGWMKSLVRCQGIFTLSNYLKGWLETKLSIPVCSLVHPTETPDLKFSMEGYSRNEDKKIIQIGWWLRKFHSLCQLPVRNLKKALVDIGYPWLKPILLREIEILGEPGKLGAVEIIPYMSNEKYDKLLSKNIVFLDLYDSSANNAIIECIVRNTPVLVNPLAAVVEYLGEDYPFYFTSIEEAAEKAEDADAVNSAHEYLQKLPIKEKLTREYFRQSLQDSEIYRDLSPFKPKVSIICSLFAADNHIDMFVENITSQTAFDQCELILSDVCASHENPAKVERAVADYSRLHDNILYRKVANDPGLYELWSDQIRMSRGKYIVMACIDDCKSPDCIERQLLALETRPNIDVVCSAVLGTKTPFERWEKNTADRTFCKGFNWQSDNLSSLGSPEEFGLADFFYKDQAGNWVDSDNLPHCMPMWRKSIHKRYGYFDEKEFGPIADWEFWLRCAFGGARFLLLLEVLGLYWENPQSHNRRAPTEDIKNKIIAMYREKCYGK